MAEVARAIGRPEEAAGYEELAEQVREAFAKALRGRTSGRVERGTQTAYVLALHMGLVPDDLRAARGRTFGRGDRPGGLAPGHGVRRRRLPLAGSQLQRLLRRRLPAARAAFLPVLAVHGRPRRDDHLGALGRLDRRQAGSSRREMNSFNHYSLGSVGEWLYRFVLGYRACARRGGLRPGRGPAAPGGSLTYARGSFRSVRGEISTAWTVTETSFTLKVEIPPNVQASVRVPSARPLEVRDGTGAGPVSLPTSPAPSAGKRPCSKWVPGPIRSPGRGSRRSRLRPG